MRNYLLNKQMFMIFNFNNLYVYISYAWIFVGKNPCIFMFQRLNKY